MAYTQIVVPHHAAIGHLVRILVHVEPTAHPVHATLDLPSLYLAREVRCVAVEGEHLPAQGVGSLLSFVVPPGDQVREVIIVGHAPVIQRQQREEQVRWRWTAVVDGVREEQEGVLTLVGAPKLELRVGEVPVAIWQRPVRVPLVITNSGTVNALVEIIAWGEPTGERITVPAASSIEYALTLPAKHIPLLLSLRDETGVDHATVEVPYTVRMGPRIGGFAQVDNSMIKVTLSNDGDLPLEEGGIVFVDTAHREHRHVARCLPPIIGVAESTQIYLPMTEPLRAGATYEVAVVDQQQMVWNLGEVTIPQPPTVCYDLQLVEQRAPTLGAAGAIEVVLWHAGTVPGPAPTIVVEAPDPLVVEGIAVNDQYHPEPGVIIAEELRPGEQLRIVARVRADGVVTNARVRVRATWPSGAREVTSDPITVAPTLFGGRVTLQSIYATVRTPLPQVHAQFEPPTMESTSVKTPEVESPSLQPPTVETPTIEPPEIPRPVVYAPVVEHPTIEAPTLNEPTVKEPGVEVLMTERPAVETPMINEPTTTSLTVEASVMEVSTSTAPTVEKPTVETPTAPLPTVDASAVKGLTTTALTVEGPTVEEPTVEGVAIEVPAVEVPTVPEPTVPEPIVASAQEVPTTDERLQATVQPPVRDPLLTPDLNGRLPQGGNDVIEAAARLLSEGRSSTPAMQELPLDAGPPIAPASKKNGAPNEAKRMEQLVAKAALQAQVPELAGIGLVLTSRTDTPLHNRRIVALLRTSLLGHGEMPLNRDEEVTIAQQVDKVLHDLGNSLESVLRDQLGEEYDKLCLQRGVHG
jgi:hypothetical protein